MLVLSRKVGERVVLPDCGVTVEVVAVSGKRVRLGFAAPPGTRVHRTEVWNRIREEESGDSGHDGVGPTGNGDRQLAPAVVGEMLAGLGDAVAR